MKQIAILGSTGSIGAQTLEVVRAYPESFSVFLLTAKNRVEPLIRQALEFKPKHVVIGRDDLFQEVKEALEPLGIKVHYGINAISDLVTAPEIDIVLNAMVGYSGLIPTIHAIRSGKDIALANKETLVVAGEFVTRLTKEYKVNLYPVDSEHSAIFQCLPGEDSNPIERIILTASGGPFRGKSKEYLKTVTKDQALKHPNWVMGAKITIDSASLMNKGLEIIEAKWLFDLRQEQIEVVVHPQSIIHSMVQFQDGSIKAQMGLPDMKLPILYALSYPKRNKTDYPRLDFATYPTLTFEKPDTKTFRNLQLAFDAMEKAGNMPCILNAANEVAVECFLTDRIGFLEMSDLIDNCMSKIPYVGNPTLEDYIETDKESRIKAFELVK